jgi:uncharacterized protein YfaS (alpha-2-macroglobulin family)
MGENSSFMVGDKMTTFQLGTSPELNALIVNKNGNPADPASVTIDVIDAEGATVVDSKDMIRNALGDYSYIFDIAEDDAPGTWQYNITMTGGSGRVSMAHSAFEVESHIE